MPVYEALVIAALFWMSVILFLSASGFVTVHALIHSIYTARVLWAFDGEGDLREGLVDVGAESVARLLTEGQDVLALRRSYDLEHWLAVIAFGSGSTAFFGCLAAVCALARHGV